MYAKRHTLRLNLWKDGTEESFSDICVRLETTMPVLPSLLVVCPPPPGLVTCSLERDAILRLLTSLLSETDEDDSLVIWASAGTVFARLVDL